MSPADKQRAWIKVYAAAVTGTQSHCSEQQLVIVHSHACKLADEAVESLGKRWLLWRQQANQ